MMGPNVNRINTSPSAMYLKPRAKSDRDLLVYIWQTEITGENHVVNDVFADS